MNKDLVSIIIPIIKNDQHIAECLEAIKKSTYTNYEIIVVDEGKERSVQRNIGYERSKGSYLLFLDSDMIVHPNLLFESICLLEGQLCEWRDALYIPEIIIGKGFWIKVRNFERSFYNGTPIDAVRFIMKYFWIPFDENLIGTEDWDWDRKIKRGRDITSYPLFHNEGEFNLWKYLKKKVYYSQSLNIFKRRYPKDKALNFWYRYFWVFVEKNKWERLIRHPILAIGMYFLIFMKGLIYLCVKKS